MNKKLVLRNYFFLPITGITPDKKPIMVARSLVEWLAVQKLHGFLSRARSRFLKIIEDRAIEVEKERGTMLKEYSKDKKGRICFFDKDGKKTLDEKEKARYDVQNKDGFDKAWNEYIEEKYIIDVTQGNNEVINGVKEILLETKDEFSGLEAVRYDEWCQVFEDVHKKEEKK